MFSREMANKDRYHPFCGVLESRVVARGEAMVRTICPRERHKFPRWGVLPYRDSGRCVGFEHGEIAGCSFNRGQYEYGGTIAALGLKGATSHRLHLVVRIVLQGDVWVFQLGVI
jgi:hypothetical protein